MKKSVVMVISFLLVVSFVSAFSFGDIFGKITGDVVEGQTCVDSDSGLDYYTKGVVSGCDENGECKNFEDTCNGDSVIEYFCTSNNVVSSASPKSLCLCSEGICNSQPKTTYKVDLEKGWNLVYLLHNPELQIIGGDINLENLKSIYQLMPVTKEYVQTVNEGIVLDDEFNTESIKMRFAGLDITSRGYMPNNVFSGISFWVYSNKSGTIVYEITSLDVGIEGGFKNSQLIRGWNFIGIDRGMFGIDTNLYSLLSDSITLNEIKGSCNILQAVKYEGIDGLYEWVGIGLEEPIDTSMIGRGISVEVNEDCVLGLFPEGTSCSDTDGGQNKLTKGVVNLVDDSGQTLTETDSCEIKEDEGWAYLTEHSCYFNSKTMTPEIYTFKSKCPSETCGEGVCGEQSLEEINCYSYIDYDEETNPHDYTILREDLSNKEDVCYLNNEKVDSCSGEGCAVRDYSCEGDLRREKVIDCIYDNCAKGHCFEEGEFIFDYSAGNTFEFNYKEIDYKIEYVNGCINSVSSAKIKVTSTPHEVSDLEMQLSTGAYDNTVFKALKSNEYIGFGIIENDCSTQKLHMRINQGTLN